MTDPAASEQSSRPGPERPAGNGVCEHGAEDSTLRLLTEADTGLLNPGWAGSVVAHESSDAAFLGHMLQVEATWTAVLADHGLATHEQAEAAQRACDPASYDLVGIAHEAQLGGNPLIPALKAMRRQVSADSSAIHVGATSQDIVDTALMRMVAEVAATVLDGTRRAVAALSELARQHRGTPMVARSLAQHSLPSTFGLRAANWLAALAQAGQRLEAAVAHLPLQWGGAAGTMASLTSHVDAAHRDGALDEAVGPFELVEDLAGRLGLAAPVGPWGTTRMVITGLAAALADITAACGRIANDVLISVRIENGELGEPKAPGRGGSSAMPHKQNPVLSVLIHSAALSAPGALAQVLTAAGAANEERPDGAWQAEWPALRQLLRTAGGTAARTLELVSGLEVNVERMEENLRRTGPLLVSERLMAELSPVLEEAFGDEPGSGRKRLQAVVDHALSGGGDDRDFGTLLRREVPESVSEETLRQLLDPANYTGQAGALVDRITAEYAGFAAGSPETSTVTTTERSDT